MDCAHKFAKKTNREYYVACIESWKDDKMIIILNLLCQEIKILSSRQTFFVLWWFPAKIHSPRKLKLVERS